MLYIDDIYIRRHTRRTHATAVRLTKKNAGRGLLWSPPKVMMFLSPLYLQHTLAYVTIPATYVGIRQHTLWSPPKVMMFCLHYT